MDCAHDLADVLEGVAHAVGADGELAGQAIFLSATMTGARVASRSAACSTILSDSSHLGEPEQEAAVGVGGVQVGTSKS